MSLWSSFLGFLLLLLVLTTSGDSVDSYGEKQVVFPLKKLQPRTWRKGYNLNPSCSSQKSRKENGATILEMKHKGLCSGAVKNWEEWQKKSLADDEIRVRSIQSHIKNAISRKKIEGSEQAQTPITSGFKLQTLNYIVTISIGSRNMTVIVDTGSDLTWVQCQPCRSCYSQPQPLFNPSLSPSYLSVPCNASACQSLQFATGNLGLCGGNASSVCSYSVSYGDGSYTNGELGRDRLALGTTSVEGFVFGCGRNNKGLFGSASGLMGLGRSDVSLISQTKDVFGGVFSYCLPSSQADDSGSLVFGENPLALKNSTPISYAAMLQNPQLYTFYTLNLTGTSVGGVQVQTSGAGGIILDSGTVITRLPPSTYKAVKAEFLKQFSGYPLAPGFSILDTCFDLSAYDEVNIPTVKLHFDGGGAELSVDATGIFYFARRDASQVCLALASLAYEAEIGIIGNYQQRNTRVIYDTKNSQVGFAKETCSFM